MNNKKKNESPLQITITNTAQELLLKDVYSRRQIEACGVLIGERDADGNWHVQETQPLNNSSGSAVYFEFAPEELLEVEMNYPDRIVGVYHSHPGGYPRASSTDKKNMQRVNLEQGIPWVWLIVCGPFNNEMLRGLATPTILAYFHSEHAGLQHIHYVIV